MLIRSINTVFMKHSRWLFAVFTVIIIISFLGFMVPGQFGVGGCRHPADQPIGQAYGEDVSYRQAAEAIRGFVIVQELATGRGFDSSNYEYGFYLAAQRKAAERRGIDASNDEVGALIRSCMAFQKNGKFDYDTYTKVLGNLNKRGLDGDFIAQAFRDEVIRTKLAQEIAGTIVPTDGEIRMLYRFYNGEYSASVAAFKSADYLKQVKVDQKALQNFFKARRNHYMIPAQMTALVVAVPFNNPANLKAANQAATMPELQKFYNANQSMFTGKDGKPAAFAAVAKEVKTRFVAARMQSLAAAQAQQFAREVYDQVGDGAGKDDVFRKAAAKYGYKVITTGRFAADASAVAGIAEPDLIRQLDQVLKAVPVTNAVVGKDAVYVGYVLTRVETRQAEMKEVGAKVTEDFRQQEALKLARAAAQKTRTEVAKLPAAKRAAAKCWNRQYKFAVWNLMSSAPDKMPPMQVAEALPGLAMNGVSEVLPDAGGAYLVLLTGWKEPDMAKLTKEGTMWEALWRQQKGRIQGMEFNRELESNCRLYQQGKGK